MNIEELERNVVDAAIAKYQAPLGMEVRADGKEYLVPSDVQELERRGDVLNHAIRELLTARSVQAEVVDWPDIIDA